MSSSTRYVAVWTKTYVNCIWDTSCFLPSHFKCQSPRTTQKRFCKNNLKNLQDAPKMPFQLTFMSSRRDCCARMSHVKKHMCRQFMKHLCILNEAPFLEICHNQNYQKKYICKYFSLRNIVQPPTLSRSF